MFVQGSHVLKGGGLVLGNAGGADGLELEGGVADVKAELFAPDGTLVASAVLAGVAKGTVRANKEILPGGGF